MIRRISKKRLAANGGKTPFLKRSAIRKKPRKPSETLRVYGGKKRIEWVKSLPCAACGVVGYSENAHVLGNGGLSRKADYTTIAPLCGYREVAVLPRSWEVRFGCHGTFDKMRWAFDKRFPDFNPEEAARTTNEAWLALSGSSKTGMQK